MRAWAHETRQGRNRHGTTESNAPHIFYCKEVTMNEEVCVWVGGWMKSRLIEREIDG